VGHGDLTNGPAARVFRSSRKSSCWNTIEIDIAMKKTPTARAHKNALSHGIYTEDMVLPWENAKDFVDLHKALREDLEPDGLTENETVLGIAGLYWKKRRLMIGCQLAYRRHPNAGALTKAGVSGWSGVEQYLESTSDQLQSFRDAFCSLAVSHASLLKIAYEKMNAILAKPEFPRTSQTGEETGDYNVLRKEAQERQRSDQMDALIESLNRIGDRVITPALKMIEYDDIEQSVAERVFRPDIIEKEVRVGALIDRQIEKGLAQLVHLKEYKRMYKKKQLNAPM
jgi:hypothetical protein